MGVCSFVCCLRAVLRVRFASCVNSVVERVCFVLCVSAVGSALGLSSVGLLSVRAVQGVCFAPGVCVG